MFLQLEYLRESKLRKVRGDTIRLLIGHENFAKENLEEFSKK